MLSLVIHIEDVEKSFKRDCHRRNVFSKSSGITERDAIKS